MPNSPYKVSIIVDPEFGNRLQIVANETPVWIVDSPLNKSAAEDLWKSHRKQSYLDGVTTFHVEPNSTPEKWCANIIGTVDEHHGEYSHDPPYSIVEVIGVKLTTRLRHAFEECGLNEFVETTEGFEAKGSTVGS
jgi:hypothetical protein